MNEKNTEIKEDVDAKGSKTPCKVGKCDSPKLCPICIIALIIVVCWAIYNFIGTSKSSDIKVSKTEVGKQMNDETLWKDILTPEQYHVLRNKGTERPFTGKLLNNKEKGMYSCAACGHQLFDSDTKFNSGTGWPSFSDVAKSDGVKLIEDKSHGMVRTEVVCAKCDGHLGHVFNDGPTKTGKRYCINSVSLKFEKEE